MEAIDPLHLRQLFDALDEGVYVRDLTGRIIYWNRAAQQITGFNADQMLGAPCGGHSLAHTDHTGRCLCEGSCPMHHAAATGAAAEHDIFVRHRDGYRVSVRARVLPLRDAAGKVIGSAQVFSDRTASWSAQQRLREVERLAFLDALTGLANRRYACEVLTHRVSGLVYQDWSFGVVLVDVDHFKAANDRFGHEAGDRVLAHVARSLASCIDADDTLARWGGDEFLLVHAGRDPRRFADLAERCASIVRQSVVDLAGHTLRPTVSVGATISMAGDGLESVVERADRLLYQAKRDGRNRACVDLSGQPIPLPLADGDGRAAISA